MSTLPFDLSKPPHPLMVDLVLPFFPGLFFEVSVYWANPGLMAVLSAHQASNAGYYVRGAIALFCAYFVGLAATMTVGLLQSLMKLAMRYALRLSASMKKKVDRYAGARIATPNTVPMRIIRPLQRWWTIGLVEMESQTHTAYQVWARAAERLLKVRYGISPRDGIQASDEMRVWHNVLGTPTAEEVRGSSFVRVMHAAGWLGIVAAKVVPALWNSYYLTLSGTLIFLGLLNDYSVSRSWSNRVYDIAIRTRCVLREIPQRTVSPQLVDRPDGDPEI